MSDETTDPNILMLDMRSPQVAVCFGGSVWVIGAGSPISLEHGTNFDRTIVKAMLRSALEAMEEQ